MPLRAAAAAGMNQGRWYSSNSPMARATAYTIMEAAIYRRPSSTPRKDR